MIVSDTDILNAHHALFTNMEEEDVVASSIIIMITFFTRTFIIYNSETWIQRKKIYYMNI